MPKQKEEPVIVGQTLTERDYGEAAAAARYFAVPLRRRSIRAALCLTAAALAGAAVPICGENRRARAAVVCAAAVFAAAALAVLLLQPVIEKNRTKKWFRSCPLAALPETVTVTRSCAVVESKCERTTEYWTDFTLCVETDGFIAAAGGRERFFLILKKTGLPQKEAERLSTIMRYAFDGRWYRKKHGKGGK